MTTLEQQRKWVFSKHATQRLNEMEVSFHEAINVLERPETDYEHHLYPGTRTMTGGRLALAVDPEERVVITVLWRGAVYDRDNPDDFRLVKPRPAPKPVPVPKSKGGKGKRYTDAHKLLALAESQGFTVDRTTNKGKWKVYDPAGHLVPIRIGSLSHNKDAGDQRFVRLLRMALVQAGLVLPD